jgi:hypothetical protein
VRRECEAPILRSQPSGLRPGIPAVAMDGRSACMGEAVERSPLGRLRHPCPASGDPLRKCQPGRLRVPLPARARQWPSGAGARANPPSMGPSQPRYPLRHPTPPACRPPRPPQPLPTPHKDRPVGRTLRSRRHLPANLGQTRPSLLILPSSGEPARQRVWERIGNDRQRAP